MRLRLKHEDYVNFIHQQTLWHKLFYKYVSCHIAICVDKYKLYGWCRINCQTIVNFFWSCKERINCLLGLNPLNMKHPHPLYSMKCFQQSSTEVGTFIFNILLQVSPIRTFLWQRNFPSKSSACVYTHYLASV